MSIRTTTAQAMWDSSLAPSSDQGATTVLFRQTAGWGSRRFVPGEHNVLIELMEGVEDIPGTALHEGLTWDWESFPEFLDGPGAEVHTMSTSPLRCPTGAVRVYVMGDRGVAGGGCHPGRHHANDRVGPAGD